MTGPGLLQAHWPLPLPVRAFTTLRSGGASLPPFDSLNLGQQTGDAPAALAENLRRVTVAAGLPGAPVWLRQVHGAALEDVDVAGARVADAALTRTPGRVLAIQTADCLPVVLVAEDGSALAAAHAGWRGLAAGVLERSAEAVQEVAPRTSVHAWLGPAIGPAAFEVGAEVVAAFIDQDPEAEIGFVENARGRWQCDLYTLARRALARAGVASISGGSACTHTDAGHFFSHRRAAPTGRMATFAWLAPGAAQTP